MRVDLFEIVEGVIRGFIHFFYSLAAAIGLILRHPFRGPLALERRYLSHSRPYDGPLRLKNRLARPEHRQIGGLTFMFIFFFALFGLTSNAAREGLAPLGNVLRSPPRLDSEAIWAPFVGAIVTSVIIDAALRFRLRARLPCRPVRRRLLLGAIEYSLAFAMLVNASMISLAVSFGEQRGVLEGILSFSIWVFGIGLFWPAAYYLLAAPGGEAATAASWAARARMVAAIIVLALFASALGLFALDGINAIRAG